MRMHCTVSSVTVAVSSPSTRLAHEVDLAMCTGMMSGFYFCECLDVND